MHSQFENYLNELAEKLSPLPISRRNEEIREMRQHLLNALIVNQEMGLSDDEAAVSALEQFGSPEDLAHSLVQVWHRGARRQRRDLLTAAVCALACLLVIPRVGLTIEQYHLALPIQSHRSPLWNDIMVFLWQAPIFVVAGAATGLAFPRKAVVGTGLVLVAMAVYIFVSGILSNLIVAQPLSLILSNAAVSLVAIVHNGSPYDLAAILGAWVGSRRPKLPWGGKARASRV